MPIALVTATRMEMQTVLKEAVRGMRLTPRCPQPLLWQERHLLLLVTGIGPVNAALALGRLFGEGRHLAGVINMGIAGSFDPAILGLGATVSVEQEIWPEFGLHTEQGLDAKALGLGHGRSGQEVIWDRLSLNPQGAAAAMQVQLPGEWPGVISLSVAGVSGTRERAVELWQRTKAQVENMEGFALAWSCACEGLPFLQVRTVSNRVGARDPQEWDMRLAKTRLREAALRVLGPVRQPLPGPGQ